MTRGLATLGGLPFLVDPSVVQWTFSAKTSTTYTVGGKVVQIYGTKISDMYVSGNFGAGDASAGDTQGWQYQQRYLNQVKKWARQAENSGPPLRFVFSPRSWDMHVYLKAYQGTQGAPAIENTITDFNPAWTLVFFVVSDNTGAVASALKDIYISRLMDGVGWKQSKYNGPSASDVATTLGGNTIQQYIAGQYGDAAAGTATTAP